MGERLLAVATGKGFLGGSMKKFHVFLEVPFCCELPACAFVELLLVPAEAPRVRVHLAACVTGKVPLALVNECHVPSEIALFTEFLAAFGAWVPLPQVDDPVVPAEAAGIGVYFATSLAREGHGPVVCAGCQEGDGHPDLCGVPSDTAHALRACCGVDRLTHLAASMEGTSFPLTHWPIVLEQAALVAVHPVAGRWRRPMSRACSGYQPRCPKCKFLSIANFCFHSQEIRAQFSIAVLFYYKIQYTLRVGLTRDFLRCLSLGVNLDSIL